MADAPPPRQRLVIKEMVLENFKSYAGVQRIGPFHKVRAKATEQLPPTTRRRASALHCVSHTAQ
jgi:hypothetical protein